jgi:hypothetical protein
MSKSTTTEAPQQVLTIRAPNLQTVVIRITGKTPYMQHRYYKKAEMMAKQREGPTAKSKKAKPARDFSADFDDAQHKSADGWHGIPAPAFRAAMISACRLVGYQMTKAKLSVFIEADGECAKDGTPLVRLLAGPPEMSTLAVRNETGVLDIRARPMWRQWQADVRIMFDADQFTSTDVVNLLMRAGLQVGIGEGRPDSKKSAGLGYGTFSVEMSAA